MSILNGAVQALVRNDAKYVNISGPDHELRVLDAQAAIGLVSVWDQVSTFAQCVDSHANPKALALAMTLGLDAPVIVSACRRRLGQPDWASKGNPEDIIILEGNHRMLAVAMRLAWGWVPPRCIGVFVAIA